jgi:hypothetical protein
VLKERKKKSKDGGDSGRIESALHTISKKLKQCAFADVLTICA